MVPIDPEPPSSSKFSYQGSCLSASKHEETNSQECNTDLFLHGFFFATGYSVLQAGSIYNAEPGAGFIGHSQILPHQLYLSQP